MNKETEQDDLLDLFITFLDSCGLFYTQRFPNEEENDVLYADISKIIQIFRSRNCKEFMRSYFGVDTIITNKLIGENMERGQLVKTVKFSTQIPPHEKATTIKSTFHYMSYENKKSSVILQTR